MTSKRHGTAERAAIPKVPRGEFAIEEHTLVDAGNPARIARQENLIPSVTKGGRIANGSTPPPNVIPFTKPRAIAAIVASSPERLIIEESANRALKGFDNTTSIHDGGKTSVRTVSGTETRVATGWTPPGAVPVAKPRAPGPTLPPGAQTLYPMPAKPAVPGPVNNTVLPVPPLHITQSAVPALGLPPLAAPKPVLQPQPIEPVRVAKTMPGQPAPVPASAPLPAVVAAPAPKQPQPQSQLPFGAHPIMPPKPASPPVNEAPPMFENKVATPSVDPGLAVPDKANKWAVFEKLGLGAPKKLLGNPQKLIVNVYKLLGFAILSIIVFVLVGYIANNVFFYMSNSWVVPMAVAPTDEKVVTLQASLAEQQNTRDKIADELNQAERQIAAQQNFQLAFAKAIKSDLDGRKAALGRVRELANNAASTRRAIKNQNSAYAAASRKRMQDEYAAGLIDRTAMLSGGFQLAQITSSNLSLAERQAEFETKAQELEAETRSLDAILANVDDNDSALSYEVLRIKQEYAASRLDLAKSIETRNTLQQSLKRQDKIVGNLKRSAYLRAVEDNASVAFVPYGNLVKAEKGASVYACRVGMVICRHVGEVLEVLPGEVQFKHPQRDKMLRGQMVEMKLDDDEGDAASGDVLFVGGKPLLF